MSLKGPCSAAHSHLRLFRPHAAAAAISPGEATRGVVWQAAQRPANHRHARRKKGKKAGPPSSVSTGSHSPYQPAAGPESRIRRNRRSCFWAACHSAWPKKTTDIKRRKIGRGTAPILLAGSLPSGFSPPEPGGEGRRFHGLHGIAPSRGYPIFVHAAVKNVFMDGSLRPG